MQLKLNALLEPERAINFPPSVLVQVNVKYYPEISRGRVYSFMCPENLMFLNVAEHYYADSWGFIACTSFNGEGQRNRIIRSLVPRGA